MSRVQKKGKVAVQQNVSVINKSLVQQINETFVKTNEYIQLNESLIDVVNSQEKLSFNIDDEDLPDEIRKFVNKIVTLSGLKDKYISSNIQLIKSSPVNAEKVELISMKKNYIGIVGEDILNFKSNLIKMDAITHQPFYGKNCVIESFSSDVFTENTRERKYTKYVGKQLKSFDIKKDPRKRVIINVGFDIVDSEYENIVNEIVNSDIMRTAMGNSAGMEGIGQILGALSSSQSV